MQIITQKLTAASRANGNVSQHLWDPGVDRQRRRYFTINSVETELTAFKFVFSKLKHQTEA